ncbi:MAG: hypothetical protein C0481_00315 [Phenylobacterium sp.]|uniref:DUF2092 domain-containing protein n=1 Tax=Phenylobacterium sp. TaxID=1871053 RepID=UPI0025DFA9C9|nr:DUF2092 domain-containing protein [Phenylobacterium sp.]MBA4010283.1 hypothetical protein [Phenylobacterium sp.]
MQRVSGVVRLIWLGRLAAAGLSLSLVGGAPSLSQQPATAPAASRVDPAAVKALSRMSNFLQSQSTFALTANTSLEVVTNDDQKIQLVGTATYKVRKPDAFVIDVVSSSWNRRYIYAGGQFTVYAPELGYYATVPSQATIQATLADVATRFGISIPLDDLFRWSSPEAGREEALDSAFRVGTEAFDGVITDHYAFREGHIDWQVWIQQGAQPLPRRVVITDRRDKTNPAYVADLTWTLNPPLTDADFAFQPGKGATRIRIDQAAQGGGQ